MCVALTAALALLTTTATQLPFFPNVRMDTGRAPAAVAIGDLDQDGRLDAVAANPSTGDVTTLLGDGALGFTVHGHFPSGSGPLGAVLSDFDGDGKLDALVPNGPAGTVAFLKGDGLGGLGPAMSIPVGAAIGSFDAGDLDLDGDLDLVIGHPSAFSAGISTVRSSGTGTFSVLTSATPWSVTALAVADATQDGIADALVIAGAGLANVATLQGDGQGGFTHLGTTSYAGFAGSALAAGDLDQDGDVDAAVLRAASSTLAVLRGNGQGMFELTSFQFTIGATALSAADFDLDGSPDLVAFGPLGAAWHEGSGVATFAEAKPIPASGRGVVVDVDGDGRNEVVSAVDSPAPSFGVASRDALSRFQGVSQSSFNPFGGLAGSDFDQDGDADLLQYGISSQPGVFTQLVLSRNDGIGNFADAPPIPVPAILPTSGRGPLVADFSGDGMTDMLVWGYNAGEPIEVGLGNGLGGVATWKSSAKPGVGLLWSFYGDIGDFDLDGVLDLALSSQNGATSGAVTVIEVRRGAGDGTFLPPAATVTFGVVASDARAPLATADADLDGRLDLILADSTAVASNVPTFVSIARATGALQYATPTSVSIGNSRAYRLAAADLDLDGDPDFAVVHGEGGSANRIALVRGDGQGGGQLVGALGPQPWLDSGSALRIVDLDGNGTRDVVTTSGTGGEVALHRGTGAFSFAPAERFDLFALSTDTLAFDIDGDGRLDLVGPQAYTLLRPVAPAPCAGSFTEYGTGCFGDSYFVPHLQGGGCPSPGQTISLSLTGGPGGAVALIFLGLGAASLPVGYGCSLLVFPLIGGPVALPLSGNGPGGGDFTLYPTIPPGTPAIPVFLQAFALDQNVPAGFSTSNGLRIDIQ